ncbi:MAG: hypothetical protein EBQ75_03365 [Actinobacteria bacterium]|nr:hypothetical protein [Actinomycetota bacterium]
MDGSASRTDRSNCTCDELQRGFKPPAKESTSEPTSDPANESAPTRNFCGEGLLSAQRVT